MEFLWCIVLNYFLTFKVVFQEPVGWCKINYEVKISWGLFTFVSVRSCVCKLSTFLQTSVPQIGLLYFTCHRFNWRLHIPKAWSLEEVKGNIYFEVNWNKSSRLAGLGLEGAGCWEASTSERSHLKFIQSCSMTASISSFIKRLYWLAPRLHQIQLLCMEGFVFAFLYPSLS